LKKNLVAVTALVLGVAALAAAQAPAPTKVGIIYVGNAIQGSKEGQKAFEALGAKIAPKKAEFEKKQADIQQMQTQLRNGAATLSEEKKKQLTNDIDAATKKYTRDTEDAQAEVEQEQGNIMQSLGVKLMEIVTKYATDNGFAVILDVSSQQTPVVWASTAVDITEQVVKLYDAKYPVAATAAAPAAAPAKPAAAAPVKK
jgi:outer membrane protein